MQAAAADHQLSRQSFVMIGFDLIADSPPGSRVGSKRGKDLLPLLICAIVISGNADALYLDPRPVRIQTRPIPSEFLRFWRTLRIDVRSRRRAAANSNRHKEQENSCQAHAANLQSRARGRLTRVMGSRPFRPSPRTHRLTSTDAGIEFLDACPHFPAPA